MKRRQRSDAFATNNRRGTAEEGKTHHTDGRISKRPLTTVIPVCAPPPPHTHKRSSSLFFRLVALIFLVVLGVVVLVKWMSAEALIHLFRPSPEPAGAHTVSVSRKKDNGAEAFSASCFSKRNRKGGAKAFPSLFLLSLPSQTRGNSPGGPSTVRCSGSTPAYTRRFSVFLRQADDRWWWWWCPPPSPSHRTGDEGEWERTGALSLAVVVVRLPIHTTRTR